MNKTMVVVLDVLLDGGIWQYGIIEVLLCGLIPQYGKFDKDLLQVYRVWGDV